MQTIDEVVLFEEVEDGMAFVPVSPSSAIPTGEAYIKSKMVLGRDDAFGFAFVAHQHPTKDGVFISSAFTDGSFKEILVRIVGRAMGYQPRTGYS